MNKAVAFSVVCSVAFSTLVTNGVRADEPTRGSKVPVTVTDSFDREYENRNTFYMEYCFVTPAKRKGIDTSQLYGHSVVYVHGLCLDPASMHSDSTSHPIAKLCSEIEDPRYKSTGASISLNGMNRTSKFLIVNDKKRVFDGTDSCADTGVAGAVATSSPVIDWNRLAELGSSPNQTIYFQNIDFSSFYKVNHNWFNWDENFSQLQQSHRLTNEVKLSLLGIGTDYAIRYVRHSYCLRFPLKADDLTQIIEFTREQQKPYIENPEMTYKWCSTDTCTHFTKNLLASTGRRWPVPTGQSYLPFGWWYAETPYRDFENLLEYYLNQVPEEAQRDVKVTQYPMFNGENNQIFESVEKAICRALPSSVATESMHMDIRCSETFRAALEKFGVMQHHKIIRNPGPNL